MILEALWLPRAVIISRASRGPWRTLWDLGPLVDDCKDFKAPGGRGRDIEMFVFFDLGHYFVFAFVLCKKFLLRHFAVMIFTSGAVPCVPSSPATRLWLEALAKGSAA